MIGYTSRMGWALYYLAITVISDSSDSENQAPILTLV